jgi:hypothetical protein
LRALTLGDVLGGADPATIRQEPGHHFDDTAIAAVKKRGAAASAVDFPGTFFVEFQGRQTRCIALGNPVRDDLPMRDAGPHEIRFKPVEIEKLAVAVDQPLIGVEHAEPMRHVGKRVLDAFGLDPQRLFEPGAVRDVITNGDPSAVRQGADVERHDHAARQYLLHAEGLACGEQRVALADQAVEGFGREVAKRRAVRQHLGVTDAGLDDIRGHVKQFEIAAIEQHDAVVLVIDANTFGDAIKRCLTQGQQGRRSARLGLESFFLVTRSHLLFRNLKIIKGASGAWKLAGRREYCLKRGSLRSVTRLIDCLPIRQGGRRVSYSRAEIACVPLPESW